MSTLSELLAEHTDLYGEAVDHLQQLVGEWQLLADLSFADLMLWAPRRGTADETVCVSQCRPTTAATVRPRDEVGSIATPDEVRRAADGVVSVRWRGEVIAALSSASGTVRPRVPSPLEAVYLDCSQLLSQMISEGTYPMPEQAEVIHSSPRAGDGLVRLSRAGMVTFASPNAQSAFHRMGLAVDLAGQNLGDLTQTLMTDSLDGQELQERLRTSLVDGDPLRIEIDASGATIMLRALPLRTAGIARGAVVLVRDVTEVKRRDRALLSKDATIREIHHRVKNNLQTVAALLRLQGRRSGNDEVRDALTEAVRRVSSIALVHEMLSMTVGEDVDLDEVVSRLVPIMAEVAGGNRVEIRRTGSLGVLEADRATPLVMVLAELVQNAVEHGYTDDEQAGTVTIAANRSARWLDIVVHDDGAGLPADFDLDQSKQLGLHIARTLVASDLGGTLTLTRAEAGGTDARVRVDTVRRRA
ncbi:sensor histidine kinase [Tomitella biformata]|uniref:sensor histidine kinase n=1 Tax=Tomitella biformata TaxID=630403 RepID=UPI00046407C4|nr:histidine kinase N-terminal domain-containing protein [Tomitella biformata]